MDKVFKSYKLSVVTAMAEVGRMQGMRIPWPAEEMTSKPFGGGSGKEFMAFFFFFAIYTFTYRYGPTCVPRPSSLQFHLLKL